MAAVPTPTALPLTAATTSIEAPLPPTTVLAVSSPSPPPHPRVTASQDAVTHAPGDLPSPPPHAVLRGPPPLGGPFDGDGGDGDVYSDGDGYGHGYGRGHGDGYGDGDGCGDGNDVGAYTLFRTQPPVQPPLPVDAPFGPTSSAPLVVEKEPSRSVSLSLGGAHVSATESSVVYSHVPHAEASAGHGAVDGDTAYSVPRSVVQSVDDGISLEFSDEDLTMPPSPELLRLLRDGVRPTDPHPDAPSPVPHSCDDAMVGGAGDDILVHERDHANNRAGDTLEAAAAAAAHADSDDERPLLVLSFGYVTGGYWGLCLLCGSLCVLVGRRLSLLIWC